MNNNSNNKYFRNKDIISAEASSAVKFSEFQKKKKKNSAENGKCRTRRRKLTEPEEMVVLDVFRQNIFWNCNERTASIVEGIPRIIRIFKEYYEGKAIELVIKALKELSRSDFFRNQTAKSPIASSPRVVLSQKYIEDWILPFVEGHEMIEKYMDKRPETQEEMDEMRRENKITLEKYMNEED